MSSPKTNYLSRVVRHLGTGLMSFFLIASATFAAEQKPAISVKAELDRAFITIGDPVEYTVTIDHDASLRILSSIPPPGGDILKIKKIEDIHRKGGERAVEGKKFTLTAFRLGEFVLDPIEIQYQRGNELPQTLKTNPLYLTVKSVASGKPKTDIRGIKPVVSIPQNFVWLFLIVLPMALAIVGFLIYRKLWTTHPVPVEAKSPMSPEEEALLFLNQLFDSDWLRRGKIKEYYLRLSEILRTYLEKRFQILAVESTTEEIRRALYPKDLPEGLKQKIIGVLEAADLVKFAKGRPEPSQTVQINQKSQQIVQEARPQEVSGSGV